MRVFFAVLRATVAVGVVAAIAGQLQTSLVFWRASGVRRLGVTVTNFFSFFTIDSNVLSVLALLAGAVLLLRTRASDPTWFLVGRLCVTAYMVTTGVVYNLLLRSIELPQGATLAWSNEVLHLLAPVYLLVDWLFAPGRRAVPWGAVAIVAAFPLVWVSYTLIRGPGVYDEVRRRDTWYPYPFLDPATSPLGWVSVAVYVVVIAAVVTGAGALAVLVSRRVRAVPRLV